MNLPQAPKQGEKIEASFMRRVLDYVRSITVSAGPGLRVNRTAAGTTITLAPKPEEPAKKADGAVLGRITGGDSGTGYYVDVYADGKGKPRTSQGVMFVADIAFDSEIPAGTWVLCHPETVAVIDGGWVS